jgi:FKBP-type peptidyl-prolyl cis-trans isomerase (trigger factor)
MNAKVTKHTDRTVELSIIIPWADVKAHYDKSVDELIKQVEIKGFRKGKAPRAKAEAQLNKAKVYEEVIKHIVPETYSTAIKENNLNPIIQPDIRLDKAKEGEDWQITAITAEMPEIKADNYKKIIQDAKAEMKKDDLWLPGKEEKKEEEKEQDKRQKMLNAILEALLKKTDITIPAIIVKNETDRRLTRLVDEIKKLGLTIDTYAKSKTMTPDQVREQTRIDVENTYKLEFLLDYITEQEKIVVEGKEVDDAIEKIENKDEKKSLENNKYYLANMIRRQKTLDRLLSL